MRSHTSGMVQGLGPRRGFEDRGMYSSHCWLSRDGIGVAEGRQREEDGGGTEWKLGKPTAKSAVTLLVKLADGHFASFAFC